MNSLAEKWRKKWHESLNKIGTNYDNEKRDFERFMKKSSIIIRVGLPLAFEDLRDQFLSLERDQQFQEELKNLVKKRLVIEKRQRKTKLKHKRFIAIHP